MNDLENIDDSGNIPQSRIKDALSAYNIWNTIRIADSASAMSRAMIDAAYDNEKPLDEKKLSDSGQSYRVNVSWGWMDMVLDSALAGYVDIFSSVDTLFECPSMYGNETERGELESVVAKEISDGIRQWPDFYWNYLRLCATFIKHGVAIALMNDEADWRWQATDMSDFKLPRKTKIGQENITIAGCLRFYSVTDLYNMIRDPDVAEELGYNVSAIRQTIQEAINGCSAFQTFHQNDWEKLESELRNNDAFFSNGSADAEMCRVVHLFVKEFDGRISHLMINDRRDNTNFLYQKIGRYDNIYQAFIIFCYGVGTNDYYHGIRGQGYKIFPTNGALNIAACQMLENATFGSAVTLQPQDESALQELQFLPNGPFNIITPGIKVLENSVIPNVSQNSVPVLNTFSQMFRDRTSQYNTESLLNSQVEKTRAQVLQESSSVSKMSISAMNLFYVPYELLMKEMVRRIIDPYYEATSPGGEYVEGIRQRLLEAGRVGFGDPKRYLNCFYALDVKRLSIIKAIGAGSEQSRMATFDRLFQLYGTYPDSGKEALVWDITSSAVGSKNAARFAARPGRNATPMVDVSIAGLENQLLLMGGQVPIVDGQNNFAHAKVHFEGESPMLQQAEQAMGTDDIPTLAKLLPGINNLNQHLSQHVEKLSQDSMMKQESAQMRQMLQQADEILHNGLLKVDKAQKQAQQRAMLEQQTGQPGEQQDQQQIDPMVLAKIEGERMVREAKLAMANQDHQQRMVIRAQQAQQDMAIKDAEASAKIIRQGVRA